jgi:hypothetical protein
MKQVQTAVHLHGAAQMVRSAMHNYAEGDWVGMAVNIADASINVAAGLRSCFPAGTKVRTKRGWIPIEQVVVSDYVWSVAEGDPTAPGQWLRVTATFKRVAPVVNWHVQGQVIRVTPQHEAWAEGKGWTPIECLVAGDELLSSDGQHPCVEGVTDSREITTVYNLQVEGYHTYFVGDETWGFDVWVHNQRYVADTETVRVGSREYEFELDTQGRTIRAEGELANPSDGRVLKPRNVSAQRELSAGTGYDAGHLIGNDFGGPGEEPNLVLMDPDLNRAGGSWWLMERELARMASDSNTPVRLVVNAHYSGDSAVPYKLVVDAHISDEMGNTTTRRWTHYQ